MSAQDRKKNLGWFGKVKTSELQKAKGCYLRTPLAVPAALFTLAVADETAGHVEATVTGRQEDGAKLATYKVIAQVDRTGGGAPTVTVVDVIPPIESDAAWACTFVASGNDVILEVTGDAAAAVRWFGVVTSAFVD